MKMQPEDQHSDQRCPTPPCDRSSSDMKKERNDPNVTKSPPVTIEKCRTDAEDGLCKSKNNNSNNNNNGANTINMIRKEFDAYSSAISGW